MYIFLVLEFAKFISSHSILEVIFYLKSERLNIMQKMPLPYKVAKSLDPFIYRNTSFDAWLATKKGRNSVSRLCFLSKYTASVLPAVFILLLPASL